VRAENAEIIDTATDGSTFWQGNASHRRACTRSQTSCRDHARRPTHLYFLHFWANDDVKKLAEGLKAAPAHVYVAKS
jgi:hypothetical protein